MQRIIGRARLLPSQDCFESCRWLRLLPSHSNRAVLSWEDRELVLMPTKSPILGEWRITTMEQWEQDYVDAEVKAYIRFDEGGGGEFQFGYVSGSMDCQFTERDGRPAVEWSWEGNDEMDEVSGRGWAALARDEKHLHGHIFLHGGDGSGFDARRPAAPRARKSSKRQ